MVSVASGGAGGVGKTVVEGEPPTGSLPPLLPHPESANVTAKLRKHAQKAVPRGR